MLRMISSRTCILIVCLSSPCAGVPPGDGGWQDESFEAISKSLLEGHPKELFEFRFHPGRPLVDWMDNFFDGLPSFKAKGNKNRIASTPWDKKLKSVKEPTYGWARIGTLIHPVMHAVTGEKGKLHPDDLAVFEKVSAILPEGCSKVDPCSCNFVGCSGGENGENLRIRALAFRSDQCRGHMEHKTARVVKLLSALPSLVALDLCSFRPNGAKLETLPMLSSLNLEGFDPEALQWVQRHTDLIVYSTGGGKFATKRADVPAEMRLLCNLKKLRFLRMPYQQQEDAVTRLTLEDIPDCLSKELTILDLRGHGLFAPPAQLELPELRSFIAFGQGSRSPDFVTKADFDSGHCTPFLESLASDDRDWKCAVMNSTLDTYLELKWPKLEKLWLDANYIQGTIPDTFLANFPELVSLDLHDNMISGSVPPNFGEREFRKLQIHRNELSGILPPRLWEKKHLGEFGIFLNKGLTGCVPKKQFGSMGKIQGKTIPGTQLTACESSKRSEL